MMHPEEQYTHETYGSSGERGTLYAKALARSLQESKGHFEPAPAPPVPVADSRVADHTWVEFEIVAGKKLDMPEHCAACGQLRMASGNNRFCRGHVVQASQYKYPQGPTRGEQFNRMSPLERHEVKNLLRAGQLRRAVRAVLTAAYHAPRVEKYEVTVV